VRALLAGDWCVTGGVLKIARRIWEVGVLAGRCVEFSDKRLIFAVSNWWLLQLKYADSGFVL